MKMYKLKPRVFSM